ncbi:TPA: acyltransferase family protein [Serratia marcescens]|uniref:acyltransferase family protein n=1 Tax=Serratia TaxID=613 RepID=UPI0018D5F822|nr:acyltransferase family protein [Serratia marcescens]MBH2765685.1 acyltransferase [Serratia marcescens]MEB7508858.1 acyltransferase [Serratia marcescens]
MRDESLDSIRGLAIIFVVLGHVSNLPDEIKKAIYLFHMPLFFIVSGYLFSIKKSRDNLPGYIKSKFRRLVIPAWFMGAICGLPFIVLLALGKIQFSEFLFKAQGTFLGYPTADHTFNCTPIWFLFSIFITELISAFFSKTNVSFIYLSILSLAFIIITSNSFTFIPFNAFVSISSLFFFCIGILIKGSIYNVIKSKKPLAIPLFIAFITCFSLSSQAVDMSANQYGEGYTIILNILGSLAGATFIISISGFITNKVLIWFGKNTLPIVGFNYFANSIVTKALEKISVNNFIFSFVIQVILLVAVIHVVKKLKYTSFVIYPKKTNS